jgi:ribosomal protein S18 acetylase RimI-like enzyme
MAEGEVQFRRAEAADIDALLRLQAGYYQEDGYAHDKGKARKAWQTFLSDTSLGGAWAVDSAAGLVGYAVVTLGYSLEYLGVDAFVDELYLVPAARGQGLGRKALSVAEAACVVLGVKALHLEVEPSKAGARELYRRLGFVGSQRVLMTKRLRRLAE